MPARRTNPPPPKTVEEVLRRAKRRLQTKGWIQKDLGSSDGPSCAVGATLFAARGGAEPFLDLLADRCLEFVTGVDAKDEEAWQWNDAPGRTKREVLQAFDAAISVAKTLGV